MKILIICKLSTLKKFISEIVEASVESCIKRIKDEEPTYEPEETPISLREGAEILGIAMPTMYSKVSKREFSSYRKGKKVYVYKSELLKFLKDGKRRSKQEIIADYEATLNQ